VRVAAAPALRRPLGSSAGDSGEPAALGLYRQLLRCARAMPTGMRQRYVAQAVRRGFDGGRGLAGAEAAEARALAAVQLETLRVQAVHLGELHALNPDRFEAPDDDDGGGVAAAAAEYGGPGPDGAWVDAAPPDGLQLFAWSRWKRAQQRARLEWETAPTGGQLVAASVRRGRRRTPAPLVVGHASIQGAAEAGAAAAAAAAVARRRQTAAQRKKVRRSLKPG
jgi:hypothetical protein